VEFGDHVFHGIETNGVASERERAGRKIPELPDRPLVAFAPEIVGGLVERAEGKGMVGEQRLDLGPKGVWSGERGRFDERAGLFEGRAAGGGAVLGPGAGAGALAVTREPIEMKLYEQVMLLNEGAVGSGKRVAQRQMEVPEMEAHEVGIRECRSGG
jgi:hypothetical protein